MSGTNTKSRSDLSTADAVQTILKEAGFTMEEVDLTGDDDSSPVSGSQRTLQSALAALNQGRFSEVVQYFDTDGCFRFTDHALTLEYTDKRRLTEFFEKSDELFPDTTREAISLCEDGEHAVAQWKVSATQLSPMARSAIDSQFPCLEQPSCASKREKLPNGPTTTTKAHRGG